MAKLFAHVRIATGALALALLIIFAAPASAQQPNTVNPNAAAVKEQQLLQELNRIQGRGTIPDTNLMCWNSRRAASGGTGTR